MVRINHLSSLIYLATQFTQSSVRSFHGAVLSVLVHSMKLVKVSEGESENENLIMAELLATDDGV